MEHIDCASDLFGDPEVHQLLNLTARRGTLEVCTPLEINVSRVLAWLFDQSEGHGLGDRALRSLLIFAGQQEHAARLNKESQDFLRPHNIHHLSLSHMLVNIELRVETRNSVAGAATTRKNSLDVVVIEPMTKLCIAIENKFGAGESPDQLKRYRTVLEERFPSFQKIYIFLDKFEAEPGDDQWLPVSYSWLNGFLLAQEENPAISADVRRTLAEFRYALQDEDEDSTSASAISRLISSVSAKHGEAIERMCQVGRPAGEKFLNVLEAISSNIGDDDGRATLSLFKLYHTRSILWDECRQRARFAPFFNRLSKEFPADLDSDVKRIKAWYSLRSWKSLVEDRDEYFFPIAVRVDNRDRKFDVFTYIDLRSVRQNTREPLRAFASEIRKKEGKSTPKRSAETFDITVTRGLGQKEAVEAVRVRLAWLENELVERKLKSIGP